jgi:hypothetical protein
MCLHSQRCSSEDRIPTDGYRCLHTVMDGASGRCEHRTKRIDGERIGRRHPRA